MNWRFCIDSAEKRALDLCRGSMNKGYGYGSGFGWDYGVGYSDSWGSGYSWGYGYGDCYGDGSSPQEWR